RRLRQPSYPVAAPSSAARCARGALDISVQAVGEYRGPPLLIPRPFSRNRILPCCLLAPCCPALRDRPFLCNRYYFVGVRRLEECAKVVEAGFHNQHGQRSEPRTSKTEGRATGPGIGTGALPGPSHYGGLPAPRLL